MATRAASLQAQIDVIDTYLATIKPTSVAADGVSSTSPDWIALSERRDKLQNMLDRISGASPMFVRSRTSGLGS
jgi:hypothetical protein